MAFSEVEKGMAKRTVRLCCSSWDELRYDEIRNKPYFIGKRKKSSETETLFPISCYKALTFDELKTCIVDSESNSVNLAVYNTDSTVVMYKSQLGLKPPILKDEIPSISNNTNVAVCSLGSTKKRKLETVLVDTPVIDTVNPDLSETGSSTDCLQIDLHSAADSELSATDHNDSECSNTR